MNEREHWQATHIEIFKMRYPKLWDASGELGAEYQRSLGEHMAKFDAAAAAPHVPTVDEVSLMVQQQRHAELKPAAPNYLTEWKAAWPALAVLRGLKEGTPEYVAGERGHIAAMEQASKS